MTVREFRTPKGRPARMSYRDGTSDWNTLYSALNEDEYGLAAHTFAGKALDIGAHIGGVAIGLAIDNPELHVTAVEPVPDNARLLRENVEANGLGERVEVIEGAAGHGDVTVWYGYRGSETAEHHAYIGNSSLAYENGGAIEHETVTYPGHTLSGLADGELSLLKIDNEGGEYDFLDDPAVSRCALIVGEVHPVTKHRITELRPLLEATHEVTFEGPNQATGPCGFRAVRR